MYNSVRIKKLGLRYKYIKKIIDLEIELYGNNEVHSKILELKTIFEEEIKDFLKSGV